MTRGKRQLKKQLMKLRKKIVLEHINVMLQTALEQARKGRLNIAEKLGLLARKLARSTGVKIPRYWKFFFCRKCKTFLIPGVTARIRVRSKREPHIVIYCYKCKNFKRIPIKRRQP